MNIKLKLIYKTTDNRVYPKEDNVLQCVMKPDHTVEKYAF